MRIDKVEDSMREEELKRYFITANCFIVEAMRKIDQNAKGILFAVDDKGKLEGVLTDGDIRRWIIKTGNLQGTVGQVMNQTPKSIYRDQITDAMKILHQNQIKALPIVSEKGRVLDIIFAENRSNISQEKKDALSGVPVIVMAGGKGTRLYPYTKILPKPLIPIGDIPIMERILNKFRDYGVNNFFVTVNYKKTMIKSYFNDADVDYNIVYVEEEKPLGTAGSLCLIKEKFDCPFIVTNCDILIHADYEDVYRYHEESKNELTVVTALKNIVVPYGVIHSSENGMIQSMEEKPQLSYFVNTGMYILNSELVHEIPKNTFFHMTDLVDKLLRENRKVGMYPISEDSFLDMGEFEEMHRMEQKLNLKSE